jgi:hypothetical protein
MLCLRTLTSSYLSRLFVSSHSIIIYHFLSQMAGDKRKGKAVSEPKKKKTRQQKEWERVLAVPDTQEQPQRGIRISEGTRSQGSSPMVRSSSSRQSSRLSSSHVGQAEGTRPQSSQSHHLHWPGPDLRHVLVTHSHSRHRDRGELQQRSSQRESSRL